VTFDQPDAALGVDGGPSGNIPAFSGFPIPSRRFDAPGTYLWRSGTQTGTIIVMPTDAPPGS